MLFRMLLLLLLAPLGLGFARAEGPPRASVNEILIALSNEQIRAAGVESGSIESEGETGELVVPGVVTVPPTQIHVVATPAAGLVETLLAQNETLLAES